MADDDLGFKPKKEAAGDDFGFKPASGQWTNLKQPPPTRTLAPIPKLPESPDEQLRKRFGASGIYTGRPAEGQAEEDRSNKIMGGASLGAFGAPLLAPAAGLFGTSALVGAGTGVGTGMGQAASGENPFSPDNLSESGKNAAFGAGSEFGLGLLGKGIGLARGIASKPGLARGVGHDLAQKYVGPRLAEAVLPEAPPQLSLPANSSLSTMPSATTGTALRPPVGIGSTTSTSGMPIHFGELPPAPKPIDPVAQAVKLRTASWLPTKMPEAAVPPAPSDPVALAVKSHNAAWLPTRMPEATIPPAPTPELGTPENPGWLAKISTRMPVKAGVTGEAGTTSLARRPSARSSPDDLISRTRALVKPGEQPTPEDLKRAGDLTQAPLSRLRELAKFDDVLAKNEINRRLRNQ